MGEAKRRREARKRQDDHFLRAVQAEAADGLIDARVFQPEEVYAVLVAAEAGDADAMRLARPFAAAFHKIYEAQPPLLCMGCPQPLGGEPFAICIITPYRPNATKGISAGLCPRCSVAEPEVLLAHAARFVKSFFPNAQPLSPVHGAPERLQ